MAPKAQLKLLKVRYDMTILNLDKLYDISQSCLASETERSEFKLRYVNLEQIYAEFTSIHVELQAALEEEAELENYIKRYAAYNQKYYDIKCKYLEMFPGVNSESSEYSTACSSGEVKGKRAFLPRIQLPTFSGRIEEFVSFIDLFESLVGKDSSLSDTERLYYLLGSLSGEPKMLTQHLSVTSENYSIALDLLKGRYHNKRLLADKLLHNLLGTVHVNKTINSIKPFLNSLIENTKALEKMSFPVVKWSYLLFFINFQKLDSGLKKHFEDKMVDKELPSFQDLIQFLETEVRILESTGESHSGKHGSQASRTHHVTSQSGSAVCKLCKRGGHILTKCGQFLALKPRQRKEHVQRLGLCFRCLGEHSIKQCSSGWSCYKCKSVKHHHLIHFDLPVADTSEGSSGGSCGGSTGGPPASGRPRASDADPSRVNASTHTSARVGGPVDGQGGASLTVYNRFKAPSVYQRTVLLATAVVRIMDKYGNYHDARALLDGGSQSTFVTEQCVNRLGLKRIRSNVITVTGLGGMLVSDCKGAVNLVMCPKHSDHPRLCTTATVLASITHSLPSVSLSHNLAEWYRGIHLADSQFYLSRPIEVLIGADLMGEIMTEGYVKVNDYLPCAINTIFGHVLMGPVTHAVECDKNAVPLSHTFFTAHATVNQILERFWEVEDIPDNSAVANPQDAECEAFFRATHQRDESGRYIVRLPFLSGEPGLGDSVSLAKRRFLAMERRLMSNKTLREKYVKFMQDYEQMGHMSVCEKGPDDYAGGNGYVIPHHGIFKAESEKIRVVFDASCGTTAGVSLNDTLHAGPKLQLDVMEIICRFRMSEYVFTTDIKMMFRQITVHEDDRRYQLIFWRESPDQPLLLYALNTVTYGMKSSPYLAIRTLRQLADDGEAEFPAAAKLLRSSVFMDDILGGADTEEEAKQLKADLTRLLRSGGFELSKWVSNCGRLLEDIPSEDLEKPRTFDKEDGPGFYKILGVEWDPMSDSFSYHCKLKDSNNCTKRIILSTLARTFDPLGWIAPVIFQGKVLMQRLWWLNLAWDETPPPDVVAEWGSIVADLPRIEAINLGRFVLGECKACSLHGFSDASENGYSAVVYLRTVDKNGGVKISLLMGKSRVAPSKVKVTIPKLELLGAALLSRLLKYIVESIRDLTVIENITCWSDSTIVLSWLRMPPHTLQTFEGNRVSQIVNCGLDLKWRHVPSELNPADVASRGCRALELLTHTLWWEPQWLRDQEATWPTDMLKQLKDLPGVRKPSAKVHVGTADPNPLFSAFSSLVKLQSAVAYWLRFIHNKRNPSGQIKGILTAKERKAALDRLIKLVQQVEFAEDVDLLKRGKLCSTRLRRLFPFVDNAGLLRVGGRLEHSNLPFQVKHPVVLPKDHPLTVLIIDHAHRVYCHVGSTALQAILQKDYWILSARQAIRSRIFKCVACFKTKAKPLEPVMSALPSDRVNTTGVFHTVQTDFAGPFSIKASRIRNSKILKAYLCVFVCSATKAVHLEVVSDLTTEAFTAALTRFTSRRGLPNVIRSDNGTNYVGTNKHLNEVHNYLRDRDVERSLADVAARSGITWLFNVPGAPHFGGLFEAAVKSAKTLLRRMIGEQVLTFEELATIFTRVEAVLNSRPLCPLSHDPQDLEVLTPAHFLVGKPLLSVPEYNLEDVPDTRLGRFKLIQAISQRFWRQWSDRYLHSLQNRNKWTTPTVPPKVGDLVLIKEENVPSLKWKRGRVVELLPGKDGVVRSVRLKTLSGNLLRPVVKIARLPLD